jgi:hypothetical protein
MKRHRNWLFPGIMLVLAALACGPMLGEPPTQTALPYWGTRTATPSGSPQAAGTALASATPGGAGGSASGGTLDLGTAGLFGAPSGIQTYKMAFDFTFTGNKADGTAVSARVQAQGTYQTDPPANSLNLTTEGQFGTTEPQTFQFTQIGDTTYVVSPSAGCIVSSGGTAPQQSQYDSYLNSGSFLTGQVERVLPDEQINGVNTNVYQITSTNLNGTATSSFGVSQITNGRLYLAQPGGYAVRILLEGTGTSQALTGDATTTGNVHYQIDFSDFGQPVNIAEPAGCAQTASANFPTLDDASQQTSAGGLFSYKSNHTFDDAVAFYRAQMPAAGWTAGQENVSASTATLLFTNGAQQATVTIAQETTGVSVSISSNSAG